MSVGVPADRVEGVAIVTGGGRGIGASIARELADAGMRVAVTGRTPDTIEAVLAQADQRGVLEDRAVMAEPARGPVPAYRTVT